MQGIYLKNSYCDNNIFKEISDSHICGGMGKSVCDPGGISCWRTLTKGGYAVTASIFDKSEKLFPSKKERIFLAHCAVSPLYAQAAEAMITFIRDLSAGGIAALPKYFQVLPEFHELCARFLKTRPENISYVHNTAEAMCMIANGYPFAPGDEVISYIHEYPSNHYPWVLQQKRGVKLVLLSDSAPAPDCEDFDGPRGWSLEELEEKISDRTRVIALSHVQFTSGFAADLQELGKICSSRNIDLVVDCAQSMGCLPVFPENFKAAAVVSAGWKWLMGPKGSALLYTSEQFRRKLAVTMAGPGLIRHGFDYLNHAWQPHVEGRKLEYSTVPWDHIAAMNVLLKEVFLRYDIKDIRDEVFRLQDLFLSRIRNESCRFLKFPPANRSGILAAKAKADGRLLVEKLAGREVVVTAPTGYLRFAPHFYNDDDQMIRASGHCDALDDSLTS